MKKQIKPASSAGWKLSLNKKTISNLSATEMSGQMGGGTWTTCYTGSKCETRNGKTCTGHKTC
jgi:hypothetical protein